ncbi:MAG: hypothetical protein ACTHON_07160 [Humibacter sp.]
MDEPTIVRIAENILARATLTVLEENAVAAACPHGVCLVPMFPGSDVVQLVVRERAVIGRVRREYPCFLPERWVAIPQGTYRPRGPFRSPEAAANLIVTLAEHAERKSG